MASLTASQRTSVSTVRGFILGANATMSAGQNRSLASADTDVPWTVKTTFPAPSDDVGGIQEFVDRAIKKYGRGNESYTQPTIEPVDAWWTTYNDGGTYSNSSTGNERYGQVVRPIESDVTIMYFHGGGFYLNSPMGYLPALQQISNMTGFRTFTPRYRLSPQNAFPAAIYDAILAYLALLYPPTQALHAPANPSKVIFAGDSAGANLALAVLQVINSAKDRKIAFHGVLRELPLPAGVTLLSAGLEQTWALKSVQEFVDTDIFGPEPSWLKPSFPQDSIWPSDPPRVNIYCERSILDHPLAAPCTQADWSWAPPIWFLGGQEIFRDSAAGVAETAAQQGANVEYHEFQDMPHDFLLWSVIAPYARTDDWPQTREAWTRWADVLKRLARGKCLQNKATLIRADGFEAPLERKRLLGYSFEERINLIRRKAASMRVFA